MVIGYIGAIIFILIQVVVLVDFAHSWAESWYVFSGWGELAWLCCGVMCTQITVLSVLCVLPHAMHTHNCYTTNTNTCAHMLTHTHTHTHMHIYRLTKKEENDNPAWLAGTEMM